MVKILWRITRWILAVFLGYMALGMLAFLFFGPEAKPEEKWQVQLWIGIDFVFFVLTFILFRSLFKKKKSTEPERIVLSARPIVKEPAIKLRFDQRHPGFVALFERVSFRGIGIKYLTYFNKLSDDSIWAARWFTIGFLPIIPISVDRLHRDENSTPLFPFVFKSTKFYTDRIEIQAFPSKLKRVTFVVHYAFTLPALLAPVALIAVLIFSYGYNLANSPLWAYLLGGLIWWAGVVYLNENWNNKRLLNSKF